MPNLHLHKRSAQKQRTCHCHIGQHKGGRPVARGVPLWVFKHKGAPVDQTPIAPANRAVAAIDVAD